MNKLLIYVRQALHMMKEEKLFSGIYIAGTALAIAFTMVITVVYYAKLADIEPEVNRSRTVYVTMRAYLREEFMYLDREYGGNYKDNTFSDTLIREWFYKMPCAELAGCLTRMEDMGARKLYLRMEDGKKILPVAMRSVDANFFKIYHHKFVYGRPFTDAEGLLSGEDAAPDVSIAIISLDVAEKLFGKGVNPVGKILNYYDSASLRIVGVIEPTSSIASESYGQLFFPCEYGDSRRMVVVLKEGYTIDDVRNFLEEKVNRLNMSDKEWEYDLQICSHAQLMMSRGRDLSSWKDIFLALLPKVFVLLLVPALNLSGLVAARMKRRLPEMGVRKACGAKKRELLGQMMTENMVLTLCGGLVGLVITWLLLYVFRSWAFFALGNIPNQTVEPLVQGEMLFSPLIFLIAFLVCAVVNLMATLIPAGLSLRNPIVESMNQKK